MQTNVTLRKFHKEDTNALVDIIRETWHYNEFSSPKTARKLADIFLHSCLAKQTYTQVALLNGVPVGIIMGKNIKVHKCPLKYRIKQISTIVSLYLSKEGREVSKIFKDVNNIDNQLLQDCKKQYQGELVLFAVSASARGKGIGKLLYDSLLNYMHLQNIKDFYLFTDTSCNYRFYEHQGMRRCCERDKSFLIKGQNVKMSFFLYDCQNSEPSDL